MDDLSTLLSDSVLVLGSHFDDLCINYVFYADNLSDIPQTSFTVCLIYVKIIHIKDFASKPSNSILLNVSKLLFLRLV